SLNKGGKIEVWEGGNLIVSISPNRDKNNVIDGWIKIEGEFEPSTTNSNIKIKLIPNQTSNGNMASVFDDIRVQPFNSTIQTYVYDPSDYTLRYILNNQNYFSEFIRDSEGSLIQKNIETEEGKKTLSVNRNNISNN
ncbi:MAG: hypothetical protein KDC67_16105, partial [Ignavibacteriae bacterium]|nr:hypothetical protein [Ignavibacteriota bacterium]